MKSRTVQGKSLARVKFSERRADRAEVSLAVCLPVVLLIPMTVLPFPSSPKTLDIAEQAQRRLRESPYFFLKNLSCAFANGILTLRGQVPFEQLRVFAELIVLRVDGIKDVENRVEVIDPMAWPSGAPRVRNAG